MSEPFSGDTAATVAEALAAQEDTMQQAVWPLMAAGLPEPLPEEAHASADVRQPMEVGDGRADLVWAADAPVPASLHQRAILVGGKEYQALRRIDPDSGRLELYCSTEGVMHLVPNAAWNLLPIWCKLPIFRVLLFLDQSNYLAGGLRRSYAEKVFSEGNDLLAAVLWWRRRLPEENKGFAVFEAGFDGTGLVALTEPPRLYIDASSGTMDGDDADAISRKWVAHKKRMQMQQRWAAKGLSAELQLKIDCAELRNLDRKARGDKYMLRGGWVSPPRAGIVRPDVARHNERVKVFSCR